MMETMARTAGFAYMVGAYGTMVGAATVYRAATRIGLVNHEHSLARAEFCADRGFKFLDQSHERVTALKNRLKLFTM